MKEKFNSLFASLKLNSSCALSKKRISDCLQHSVPLNCLNLRPTSSKAQSTQYLPTYLPTQSGDLDRFSCTDDLSFDLPNFDLGMLKRNPSPDSNDFLADLSRELEVNNVVSPLKDLFQNASQKRNVLYDVNPIFGHGTDLPIFQLLIEFIPIQALLFTSGRYFLKAHCFMLGLLGWPDVP